MASQEETFKWLLELGNPAERRTRGEVLLRAFRTALMLTDADAVVALLPQTRTGERLALYAGSEAFARLQSSRQPSEVIQNLARTGLPLALPNLSDLGPAAPVDGCPGIEAGPALFTPLKLRQPDPAYFALYRRRGRLAFTGNEIRLMLMLGAWLSTALESLRLTTGTERLAVKDDLTEVYNHHFLKSALQREVRRAGRFGHELSVVMIDIDRLEPYSHENGDLRGSLLLKEVTSVLAKQVRSFDIMGRHGDDEFMLILPQTGVDGALEVAERMRSVVEQYEFPLVPPGAVTVSLGVAAFPATGAEADDLVAAAGRALKQAKQRGRNRVEAIDGRAPGEGSPKPAGLAPEPSRASNGSRSSITRKAAPANRK
jgi:diguanylate cyclase (GGDEF)-like protein